MAALRNLARLTLSAVLFLASGLWNACGRGMYGIDVPMYGFVPAPHDPSVTIEDFSYTPTTAVLPGDTVEFHATTSKPTSAGEIFGSIGDPPVGMLYLFDNGIEPDMEAGDGIWTCEWEVPPEAPPGSHRVVVHMRWFDGFTSQRAFGQPLTILDPEDSE
jgi:hypothetical protein